MRLFMYQSAAESIVALVSVTSYNMCKLGLPDILSYSLFFSDEWQYRFGALNLLKNSSSNISTFAGIFLFMVCLALCFDLILMLTKPFMMKDKLISIYIGTSLLGALVFTIVMLPSVYQSDKRLQYVASTGAWLTFLFYIGLVLFSTVFAAMKLSKPGISSEVRRLVLVRHILTMTTFLVVNFYPIVGTCVSMMPRWHGNVPQIDGTSWRVLKIICQV